jgi:hypothetical protein
MCPAVFLAHLFSKEFPMRWFFLFIIGLLIGSGTNQSSD